MKCFWTHCPAKNANVFTRLRKWIGPILGGRIPRRRVQLGGFASSAPFYWDIIDIQQGLHSEPLPCGWLLLLEGSVCLMSEWNPVLVTSTWLHAQPLNRLFSCPWPAETAGTVYYMCASLPCQRLYGPEFAVSPRSPGHGHERPVLSGTQWFFGGLQRGTASGSAHPSFTGF